MATPRVTFRMCYLEHCVSAAEFLAGKVSAGVSGKLLLPGPRTCSSPLPPPPAQPHTCVGAVAATSAL